MLNLSLLATLLLVTLVSGNNDVTTTTATATATATATNTTSQYWTVFFPTNTPTYDLVASIPFTYEGGGFWRIAGIFCGAQYTGSTITNAVAQTWNSTTSYTATAFGMGLGTDLAVMSWPATCSLKMAGRTHEGEIWALEGQGDFVVDYTITGITDTTTAITGTPTAITNAEEPTATVNATNSQIPIPTSVPYHTLSAGAKAGIAVGAIIGIIIGAVLITDIFGTYVIMRWNLARLPKSEESNSPGKLEFATDSSAHEKTAPIFEADSTTRHEMYVSDAIIEMSTVETLQQPGPESHELSAN